RRSAASARAACRSTVQLAVEQLEDRTVPTLVAAYGFDEGTGSTVLDASGNGNNGTIPSPVWTAGKYGGALQFNGSPSTLVTVPDSASLHLTTGMTLQAWLYPTAASTDWTAAVIKERGTTSLAYALYATDGANQPPAGYVNIGGTD